ncbi:MAG: uridine kinase [Saprospiraceae bacterium]|nr:uridine kinase [Saprospiraceae bacterium]
MAYLIGITGGSGSGKTSFIRDLRVRFSEQELCIVSQDDYYRPREEQILDPKGVRNFDLPGSIDHQAFLRDIQGLLNGETIVRQEYTFNNEKSKPGIITFKPAPIFILEGLFVFYLDKIRELLDLKVFVHAKENLKVIRRIKRDQIERNYPLEDVLYRYEQHVLPTFEQYILPFREDADIVINNNLSYHSSLEVLCGFIQCKLDSTGL